MRFFENVKESAKLKETKREFSIYTCNDRLAHFGALFSKNEYIQSIFRAAHNHSDSLTPALIEGEMGTGKKSLALEMHCHVHNPKNFFIFDVENDSFEKFKSLNGSTVFIEEIDRLTPLLQEELVSYLKWQKKSMQGARVIAATSIPLDKLVHFKYQLLYHFRRIHFYLSPLRERKEDILPLIDFFVAKFSEDKKGMVHFSHQLLGKLIDYHWPLNVSELKEEIRYLIKKYGHMNKWGTEMVPSRIVGESAKHMSSILKTQEDLTAALEKLEKAMILESLVRTNWNKSRTSRELGISRSGLIQKVEKYGLIQH